MVNIIAARDSLVLLVNAAAVAWEETEIIESCAATKLYPCKKYLKWTIKSRDIHPDILWQIWGILKIDRDVGQVQYRMEYPQHDYLNIG